MIREEGYFALVWIGYCGALVTAGYLLCWLQVHGIE
jgi:hypothetical protein